MGKLEDEVVLSASPPVSPPVTLDSIERAIADIAAGKAVVVIDSADSENDGDLIFAAEHATAELLAFTVRHCSGYVCVALSESDADRLALPPMYHQNQDRRGTAYAITVDASEGVSTGISARDRSHTIRLLADDKAGRADLSRPGHVVPLRARVGGVLRRPGHTETATDLATLAGLRPAAVLSAIVSELNPTEMAKPAELRSFADQHGLTLISVADLIAYRRRTDMHVQRGAAARVPMPAGEFTAVGYSSSCDDREHVAFVYGDLGDGEDVLAHVHAECLTGDVFGSLRCDCCTQLQTALADVAGEGRGVVVYMRGDDGRGVGLLGDLEANERQDLGLDSNDANLELGLPADRASYGTGAQILVDLGVRSVRLIANTPAKRAGLERYGLTVINRLGLSGDVHNIRYLNTKRDRMGQLLDGLPAADNDSSTPSTASPRQRNRPDPWSEHDHARPAGQHDERECVEDIYFDDHCATTPVAAPTRSRSASPHGEPSRISKTGTG